MENVATMGLGSNRPTQTGAPAAEQARDFRRILVATDFSRASTDAVEHAAALAEKCGATLTVLHVIDVNAPATLGTAAELMRSLWAREEMEMARLMARLSGRVAARTEVEEGLPSEVIVEKSREFDLVILGRKRSRWNPFSRHTVQRVARKAACRVMVVEEDDLGGDRDSELISVQKEQRLVSSGEHL
jgi:nucleotide-binding universal stress UspA family protein